ncbi:hypothetical protein DXG01_001619 [Tephrocybe rancida]|nr:hypothetical protein DXG01_001619 [Tephrocybe rancida]
MVFGLFSRKREPTTESKSEVAQAQLRTPSPSVVDKQNSPSREPPMTPSPPPEAPQPADLRALIQSIPPQIFHSYTLSRLHPSNSVDPETLLNLSTFFSQLQPPPQLHCVRCHKSYFDIENNDRSCLVAHDDESAEVERVSSKAKGKGTLYETLWGCCGKTVEGDGDMGPPDGWCYEGKHTTDNKRARFRADSTMHDDKLTSCERLRCGMSPRPARTTRKRGRPIADEGDDDDGEQSSASSSHPSTTTSPRSSTGGKRKKPRTRAPPAALEFEAEAEPEADPNQMDVDKPSAPTPPSPKPKPKSRAKPKSTNPKSSTTPKTSSPLVLAPPFVSRPSSPERPNKAQVVITSSPARHSMQPPGSPERPRKDSGSSVKPTSTHERSRKDSTTSTKSRMKGKGKAKAKGLDEVVDSSVDAERTAGWTPGA